MPSAARAKVFQRSRGPSPLFSLALDTRPRASQASVAPACLRRLCDRNGTQWSSKAVELVTARLPNGVECREAERTESGCFRTGTSRQSALLRVAVQRRPRCAWWPCASTVAGVTDARRSADCRCPRAAARQCQPLRPRVMSQARDEALEAQPRPASCGRRGRVTPASCSRLRPVPHRGATRRACSPPDSAPEASAKLNGSIGTSTFERGDGSYARAVAKGALTATLACP